MIRYKAEEYGIKVIVREERYTSRQSALDFDQLPKEALQNPISERWGKQIC